MTCDCSELFQSTDAKYNLVLHTFEMISLDTSTNIHELVWNSMLQCCSIANRSNNSTLTYKCSIRMLASANIYYSNNRPR